MAAMSIDDDYKAAAAATAATNGCYRPISEAYSLIIISAIYLKSLFEE